MSRSDFAPELAAALDRFDVPAMRPGFAERVSAAAMGPSPIAHATPRRDRRGMWKRGRQFVLGSVAVGMLSAAAVASGLLGAAGIRVPVLTEMLAPDSVVVAKPVTVAVAKPRVVKRALPVAVAPPAVEQAAVPMDSVEQAMIERRSQRIAARRAFVATRPGLARLMAASPVERRIFLAQHPELARLMTATPAQRQQFLARNPEMAQALRERGIARRTARIERLNPTPVVPSDGATTAPLPDRPVIDPVRRPFLAERLRSAREARAAQLGPPSDAPAMVGPLQAEAGLPRAATVEPRPQLRSLDDNRRIDRPGMASEFRERRAGARELRQVRRQRQRVPTPR